MTIEGRSIEDGSPCFVIAEIGHNHRGVLDTAQEPIGFQKMVRTLEVVNGAGRG